MSRPMSVFKCVVYALFFFLFFSGGAFPFTVGRIEHGYNVRPDLCATNCKVSPRGFLGKFYTDALVHDAKALNLLVDIIGEVCIFICQTCDANIYKEFLAIRQATSLNKTFVLFC